MRGQDLLDKMEHIDSEYIEQAQNIPFKRKNKWVVWGVMAACLCLIAASVMIPGIWNPSVLPNSDPISKPPSDPTSNSGLKPIVLPKLPEGVFGDEGYVCYDPSGLENGNPWNQEMNLPTLPVYKNGIYDESGAGVPKGWSEAEMTDKLNSALSALKLESFSVEVYANGEDDTPTDIVAQTDKGTVFVSANGHIRYILEKDGERPDLYYYTSDATDEQARQAVLHVMELYADFFNFDHPHIVVKNDASFSGDSLRRYYVYNDGSTDVENILNYYFCTVEIVPDYYGKLSMIDIYDMLIEAEKIGDYPIITVQQAKERLFAGNYQTNTQYAFRGEEYIVKVELVYFSGPLSEMLLPYYRFYVELSDDTLPPSSAEKGLRHYGAYYVSALAGEYIANIPEFQG